MEKMENEVDFKGGDDEIGGVKGRRRCMRLRLRRRRNLGKKKMNFGRLKGMVMGFGVEEDGRVEGALSCSGGVVLGRRWGAAGLGHN